LLFCTPAFDFKLPQANVAKSARERLGNLIALCDGHRVGFGPSIRRPTPGITTKIH